MPQQRGEGWGVVAWENNVEGYVVPNLDALIDAKDLVGFARVGVDVTFDAYVRAGSNPEDATVATAHAHGLAQCKRFIAEHHLEPTPAPSNAAACRDIKANEIAFGPSICGELYNVTRIGTAVQDYQGAQTDFLVLAPRKEAGKLLEQPRSQADMEYESVLTLIPLVTGPGVLANLLDVFRDAGLNMTSFISRPIKGRTGTYSFIATLDAAPWEQRSMERWSKSPNTVTGPKLWPYTHEGNAPILQSPHGCCRREVYGLTNSICQMIGRTAKRSERS